MFCSIIIISIRLFFSFYLETIISNRILFLFFSFGERRLRISLFFNVHFPSEYHNCLLYYFPTEKLLSNINLCCLVIALFVLSLFSVKDGTTCMKWNGEASSSLPLFYKSSIVFARLGQDALHF